MTSYLIIDSSDSCVKIRNFQNFETNFMSSNTCMSRSNQVHKYYYCTWLILTWHNWRQACVSTNVPNKCRRKRIPSKSFQYHRTSYSSDGDSAPTSRYFKTPMSEYCDLTALLWTPVLTVTVLPSYCRHHSCPAPRLRALDLSCVASISQELPTPIFQLDPLQISFSLLRCLLLVLVLLLVDRIVSRKQL